MLKAVAVSPNPSRVTPHNFEAEQALLGAILLDNRAIDRSREFLHPEHFAEPLHGRIWELALRFIDSGKLVSALTLKSDLTGDVDLQAQGGDGYLARLVGGASTVINALDYGRLIYDLHLRRELIALGEDMVERGFAPEAGSGALEQVTAASASIDALGRLVGVDGVRNVSEYRDEVKALYEGRRRPALSTGFEGLDRYYRVRPGDFSVVTGVPSSGKSEIVDAITFNLAQQEKWKFAICSFENAPDEHIAKLAQKFISHPFFPNRSGRMSEVDLDESMDWIEKHYQFIRAERDSPTIEWALARAKTAVDRFGINGLVLDPYNRFEHKRPAGMNEAEYLSQNLSAVQRFAQRNKVHVWFVAHPAKPHPDRRDDVPSLYDISGGAHWANIADVGLSIQRPFLPDGSRSNEIEVHVKKARFRSIGKPGMSKLLFDPYSGRYSDVRESDASHWTDD